MTNTTITTTIARLLEMYPPPEKLRHGPNKSRPHEGDGFEDTIEVVLTQGVIALVNATDWCDLLHRYRWYAQLSPAKWTWNDRWVMRATARKGRQVLAHVLVASLAGFEDSPTVDHIQHQPRDDRLIDNRRANLRPASFSENGHNARIEADGFRGALLLPSGRWRASIRHDGKRVHLGVYDTEEEAAAAYRGAARVAFGEFATCPASPSSDDPPF